MRHLKKSFNPFLIICLLLTLQPLAVRAQDVPAQIVFTYGPGRYPRLHIINADGSGEHPLDSNDVFENNPQVSPDGRMIAFLGNYPHRREVFVIKSDGSEMYQLTHFEPCLPPTYAWSPDSTQLVVGYCAKTGDNYVKRISIVNLDGAVTAEVPVEADGRLSEVAGWSPDGQQFLLVYSMPYRNGPRPTIFTVNKDGTNLRMLTSKADWSEHPDYSPDGTQIVYAHTVDNKLQMAIMNTDGSNDHPLRLDNPPLLSAYLPAWSPDGKQIVFVSFVAGMEQLWVINADGTELKQLTSRDANTTEPDWLPAASTAVVRIEATAIP